jgi:hypothetical protein
MDKHANTCETFEDCSTYDDKGIFWDNNGYYIVILVFVVCAFGGNVQIVIPREAQSGKVWFSSGGILPSETCSTNVASVVSRNHLAIFERRFIIGS